MSFAVFYMRVSSILTFVAGIGQSSWLLFPLLLLAGNFTIRGGRLRLFGRLGSLPPVPEVCKNLEENRKEGNIYYLRPL
jgi:hypothetical protein